VDGRIQEAVEWLERSCRQRSQVGEDDPNRLLSQHELAGAYRADGQVHKAMALLEHIVSIEARTLRDDHPLRLVSVEALANMFAKLAVNPDKALSISRDSSPVL
jgi:hypothetical protein